ncbi:spondin domain-containing protein [Pareuzebyella sediminis]|uniref:spondin domain-containing protein n=1 Tax=Pareuzebyella sediminis TaxID=2607998 RepID=UPI0011F03424|nr:spondin domain-containing protein [Pareuzebyella sediminis]
MKRVKKKIIGLTLLGSALLFTSCEHFGHGPGDDDVKPTTTYKVTLTNTVNYLNALAFNTPNGAMGAGPLTAVGQSYSIDFKAVNGARLSFATMSGVSNDWFFAPSEQGISLFDSNGPIKGDITDQIYLWDDGTEEEDPATFGGMDTGIPDDNTAVRVVEEDVTNYMKVWLDYDDSSDQFTLTIENIRGVDVDSNPIAISPGVVVLHAQNSPFFKVGQEDYGFGLEKIAREGNPTALHSWFTEVGKDGAPVRLSSSFTVFAPGVVYAFESANDPVFSEGEMVIPESGIEQIAEDGNNMVLFDYITETLHLPGAKSNETAPVGPGESLTFTIDVPKGYKLGINSMFVFSNDWFVSFGDMGYALSHGVGKSKGNEKASRQVYLFDAGTEVDQPIGFGPDQAPFQSGPNTGADDTDNTVRRVTEINDVQFGKGVVNSSAGVTANGDARGGYNLVSLSIETY